MQPEKESKFIKTVYNEDIAHHILREDLIGLPTISNITYLTSANRAHHVFHLAQYKKMTGADFWDCKSIIEWGGGYGNTARIIRRMNPEITYTIIDLPELLALQYVYLSSILGKKAVNVVLNQGSGIVPGRINLISSQSLQQNGYALKCDGFLSTWAITESPQSDQTAVRETEFFNAKRLLMAAAISGNNFIRDHISEYDIRMINFPTGYGIGKGNEYWFR